MRYAVAVAVGLGGVVVVVLGVIWSLAIRTARRGFERALASGLADQTRQQMGDMIERVQNPILRRILNRRMGEMAGSALIGLIRKDLEQRARAGLVILGCGAALVVLAFFVPGLWGSWVSGT